MLDEFRKLVEKVVKANPKGRPLDKEGRYYGNPVPLEPPVGYVRSKSIAEQIRDMVRSERLKMEAENAGYESFEDADDFDVDDDFDPRSPFEENFDFLPVNQGPADPPAPEAPPAQAAPGTTPPVGGETA